VLLVGLAMMSVWLIVYRGWLNLKEAPRTPELFSPAVALMMIVMMFALGRLAVMFVSQRANIPLPTAEHPHEFTLRELALLTLGTYAAQSIVAAAYAWRAMTSPVPPPDRRTRPVTSIVIGCVALVLMWPVLMALGNAGGMIVSLLRGEEVSRIAHSTLQLLHDGPADRWKVLMSALVVIGAPVLEEVMYRGLLQRTIISTGMRAWPAIVVTSLMFAAMHINAAQPHAVVTLFVLSLVFGWAFQRTGRLLAPIAMHIAFNAANLALGLWT
jgi:membrane protease YdiL (CAAX protease family)